MYLVIMVTVGKVFQFQAQRTYIHNTYIHVTAYPIRIWVIGYGYGYGYEKSKGTRKGKWARYKVATNGGIWNC